MDEHTGAVERAEPETRTAEPQDIETLVVESEPAAPTRGRRGRPRRGSDGSLAASADGERESAAAAPSRPRRKKATKAQKAESGAELAGLITELANLLAQTVYGPEAVMNPVERGMIEPALGNILSRTSDEALTRFLGFSDLLLLGVGTGLWLKRVSQLPKGERSEEREVPSTPSTGEEEVELGKVELELPPLDDLWATKLG